MLNNSFNRKHKYKLLLTYKKTFSLWCRNMGPMVWNRMNINMVTACGALLKSNIKTKQKKQINTLKETKKEKKETIELHFRNNSE